MRSVTIIAALLCLSVIAQTLAGCASPTAPRATKVSYGNGVKVSGVVTYRERIALPADAVVTARLVDVSKPGAGTPDAIVLAEQVISHPGQVPVPFVLTVAPGSIDQNRNYAVEATITIARQVRWRTTQQYGALTRGNPSNGLMIWVQQTE